MKNYFFLLPCCLFYAFFTLLIFSTNILAQSIQPDEQIVREMIAYVAKQKALAKSRSRISRPIMGNEKGASNRSTINSSPQYTGKESNAIFALEHKAFDILNQQRINNGLEPLRWSDDLAKVARQHSENMARYKFFSHEDRNGFEVRERAKAFGIPQWRAIGENIAFNQGFSKPVESACAHWMASSGHRENILDEDWRASGIGVAKAPDGTYYFTQVFVQ